MISRFLRRFFINPCLFFLKITTVTKFSLVRQTYFCKKSYTVINILSGNIKRSSDLWQFLLSPFFYFWVCGKCNRTFSFMCINSLWLNLILGFNHPKTPVLVTVLVRLQRYLRIHTKRKGLLSLRRDPGLVSSTHVSQKYSLIHFFNYSLTRKFKSSFSNFPYDRRKKGLICKF